MTLEVDDDEIEERNRRAERLAEFMEQLRTENDRAAVIVGAAILDALLLELLRSALAPRQTSKDTLLENNGPLSSFSARTLAAFRLGLIDKVTEQAVTMIRKLRNSMAHEVRAHTLTEGVERDRVDALFRHIISGTPLTEELFDKIVGKSPFRDVSPEGKKFRFCLSLIMIVLEESVASSTPIFLRRPPGTVLGSFV